MTLESQLADAITATNALTTSVEGWKGDVDGQLAAALAAAPKMVQTRYVDAVAGVIGADGLTAATAMQGLAEAVASVQDGRIADIRLLADTPMERVPLSFRDLLLFGQDASGAGVLRRLYFVDDVGAVAMPAIYSYVGGRMIYFRSIDFELPNDAFFPAVPTSYRQHLDFTGNTLARIYTCRISNPSDAANAAAWDIKGVLEVSSLTIEADADGHVFYGIASGADPNSDPLRATNLLSA